MAVSPSFCFSDTSSESVLSCSSNSYCIHSICMVAISRRSLAVLMPYQFEPELSPHGNSPVDVALSNYWHANSYNIQLKVN